MSGTCGSILPCLVYLLVYRRVSQERLHAQLPHKRNIPNITWRAFSVEAVGTSHDTSIHVVCKRAAFVWSSPRALSLLFTNNGWKWSSSAQDAFCRRVAGSIAGDHAGQRPAAHYFRQRPRCFGAALSTFTWNSGAEERGHWSREVSSGRKILSGVSRWSPLNIGWGDDPAHSTVDGKYLWSDFCTCPLGVKLWRCSAHPPAPPSSMLRQSWKKIAPHDTLHSTLNWGCGGDGFLNFCFDLLGSYSINTFHLR